MLGGEGPSSSSRWIDNVCPGVRFSPQDGELIIHFLRRRCDGQPLPFGLDEVIPTLRLYGPDGDPRSLFETLPLEARHPLLQKSDEFYIFTHWEHYNGGDRPSRVAGPGTWSSNRERSIFDDEGEVLGSMSHLTFKLREEEGRGRKRSKGVTTNWVMHEYSLPDPPKNSGPDRPRTDRRKRHGSTTQNQPSIGKLVLCRIRFTKGASELKGCSVSEEEKEGRPGKRRRGSSLTSQLCNSSSTLPPTWDLDFPMDHQELPRGRPPATCETVLTPPPTENQPNSDQEDPQPGLQQHITSSEAVDPFRGEVGDDFSSTPVPLGPRTTSFLLEGEGEGERELQLPWQETENPEEDPQLLQHGPSWEHSDMHPVPVEQDEIGGSTVVPTTEQDIMQRPSGDCRDPPSFPVGSCSYPPSFPVELPPLVGGTDHPSRVIDWESLADKDGPFLELDEEVEGPEGDLSSRLLLMLKSIIERDKSPTVVGDRSGPCHPMETVGEGPPGGCSNHGWNEGPRKPVADATN